MIVWSAITILAMMYGALYNWPDNVHTDYGFPLVWAIHTESVFAGPVDVWSVNLTNLVANIAIWTILSLALVTLIGVLIRKRK